MVITARFPNRGINHEQDQVWGVVARSASVASFGRILGGFLNYSYALQSYYVNANQVYQMRVSTAP